MVWHHCYISLPYAAVYLTLWRTVVGFAPSQRRSKRFDSPTIRAPICRNPWQACLSTPPPSAEPLSCISTRRGPKPAASPAGPEVEKGFPRRILGRRRAREGGAAFSDSWRESGRNPLLLLRSSMLQSEHAYSSRVDASNQSSDDTRMIALAVPFACPTTGTLRIKGRFALETFYYQQRRYFAQNRMFNAYHDAVHCPCLIGKPPAAHLTETQITTVRGSRLATLHLYELRHCVRVNDTAHPPPVRSAHHTNLN